ncbi:type II toxin-antitoxin system VapC family toxin [Microlunatus soli]|uniref:Ribonuclease VapC n=1 Tax=Microlunatus soli TaxID=630515 RepID=A0A1H2A3F2_9ACTN|nr:type II toxin-antitoxin system VapC family toxin [Microlunatus soli]SDT40413.1 Predicted nucleic acid-binding protein, contains PIN domain [Microlunatus soli]
MLYFDTSALMKLCRVEPESADLRRWLATQPGDWFTSALTEVELCRALARSDPAALPRAAQVLGDCAIFDIDDEIRQQAASLRPVGLRSLDAIHLATALEVASDLAGCLTYDLRLAEAANAAGLTVRSPGSAG